jgi:hypothetical protein
MLLAFACTVLLLLVQPPLLLLLTPMLVLPDSNAASRSKLPAG